MENKTIIAINGSPRKTWNTATLLNAALEGAASQGADTELIHLYDLNFKGCISCFACKRKGGISYGNCAINDDLTPVLSKIRATADALIMGSPIYFGNVSGEMRSFLERLMFPYLVYSEPRTVFPRKIRTGFIYTMNVTEEQLKDFEWDKQLLALGERWLKVIFGDAESLFCTDTCQFDDYSQYVVTRFDPEKKAKRRAEVFPRDCGKAYNMGIRFALRDVNAAESTNCH